MFTANHFTVGPVVRLTEGEEPGLSDEQEATASALARQVSISSREEMSGTYWTILMTCPSLSQEKKSASSERT